MSVTAQTIDDYFQRFGWTYSREGEQLWITGVRTKVSAFRIMVRLTEHWVFFIINPLVVCPPKFERRLRLYHNALRYNLEMNMTKLGIDADGDVFMAVELPTESFDYSHFVDALDALAHHSAGVFGELFNLAHHPDHLEARFDDELDDAASSSLITKALPLTDKDDDEDIILGGHRLRFVEDNQGDMTLNVESLDDTLDTEDDEAIARALFLSSLEDEDGEDDEDDEDTPPPDTDDIPV